MVKLVVALVIFFLVFFPPIVYFIREYLDPDEMEEEEEPFARAVEKKEDKKE